METPPFVSVVIPTHSRPAQLAVCLESLCYQDYPTGRFEVIVVDDGGRKLAVPAAAVFQNRLSITLLSQSQSGPASARNAGAGRARGQVLVFVDDDCAPTPGWISAIAAHFTASPDGAVGGRTLNRLSGNLCAEASQQLVTYLYAYYNDDLARAHFLTSNNVAFPADGFRAIGGFDGSFCMAAAEDRELCDRWLDHGHRMTYAPEALVYHSHHLSLRGFVRQHFRYGQGAFHFHQVRARRNASPIRLEPLRFYLGLFRFPFTQTEGWRACLIAVLLIVAQVANASGFWWQKRSRPAQARE